MITNETLSSEIELLKEAKENLSSALDERIGSAPSLFLDYGDGIRSIPGNKNYILRDYVERSIKSFSVSADAEYIRPYAFANCKNLTEITILSTVKKIGENAFLGCDQLSLVTFENNWTGSTNYIGLPYACQITSNTPVSALVNYSGTISDAIFTSTDDRGNVWRWHATNVEGNDIALWRERKNNGSSISEGTVHNNLSVQPFFVPDVIEGRLVKDVGNYYMYCGNTGQYNPQLSGSTLYVSQHLRNFGEKAFRYLPIAKIEFPFIESENGGTVEPVSIGQYCFATLTCYNTEDPFEFPRGDLSVIPKYAFEKSLIRHITIPDSTLRIDEFAINQCSCLKEFTMPSSVVSVYMDIFGTDANSLSSVYIGKNLKYWPSNYTPTKFAKSSWFPKLESITYGCYLSVMPSDTPTLTSLKTLTFEDSRNTISQVSSIIRTGIAYNSLISTGCIVNAFDAAATYANLSAAKVNGTPITILSTFPSI